MSSKPLSTDRQIAALRPREKPFEMTIAGARGLVIRVFPSGTRSFEFRYVNDAGRRRRLPLGPYPGLSLADARDRALAHRAGVVAGQDPVASRLAEKTTARSAVTLSVLAPMYWAAAEKGLHGGRKRPKATRSLAIEQSRWRNHIEPELGALAVSEVRRGHVRDFMQGLAREDRLSPDTISSIGGTLSSVLAFAVHEEMLDANPATGLTKPLATRRRERRFGEDDLRRIWRALGGASIDGQIVEGAALGAGPALRLAMLTLCRRSEVAHARWSEFDLSDRVWTIPSERTKARRPHLVPLSTAAMELLGVLKAQTEPPSPFVFPSRSDPDAPLTPDAMTRALVRLCDRLEIARGTPHDFRRTGATRLTSEQYGVRRFIVGKILGHAPVEGAAVTEVYDLHDYLPEKRHALELWANHLCRTGGAENVIAIGDARRTRSAD